jgi:hypothetical protein
MRAMPRRGLAIALAAALGCATSPPPRPPALVGRTKQFAPLAIRDDAKLPGQAVILGTDGGIGSTVLALPAQPARVTVDAMTPAGVVAIALVAAPSPPGLPADALVRGAVTVGDGETAAARWNAGLWTAAHAAADALGKDLADVTFTATPRGPAARIAAPALIAAGFLASLTGAAIDPAASVIGALAPDGTIGPIDGVGEHVTAALAAGKTRIGVPVGMRGADLVARARARHAEIVELATLPDAYRLLTGKPLPASIAVDERDMALDADALRVLDLAYAGWQQRLAGEWAALLQLEQAGVAPPALAAAIRTAKQRASEAEALRRGGAPHVAYRRIVEAWTWACAANRTAGVLRAVAAGKLDAARAAITAIAPGEPSPDGVLDQVGARRPTSLAGHLAMLTGFAAGVRGAAADRTGAARLDELAAQLVANAALPALADALIAAARSRVAAVGALDLATQALALVGDHGARYVGAPDNLARVAAAIRAAAAAMRGAADDGVAHDRIATWRDSGDPGAALAAGLLAFAAETAAFDDTAAIAAHADARAVCAGTAAGAPCEALRPWLTAAARMARAEARAARIATGEIPLAARWAYQRAVAAPATDLDAQLAALDDLWASTAASRAAIVLARNG